MASPSLQPGYVYALVHPEMPAWHKVGRTYRPPHARAEELARTAWPSPFEVVHARFFWDSVAAESEIHRLLAGKGGRQREFFQAPLDVIQATVDALPTGWGAAINEAPPAQGVEEGDEPWSWRTASADEWAASLDYRMQEWEQGELEVQRGTPHQQRQGWRRWMRLSAEGWAEGSWRLAERLIQATPGPDGAHRAAWVFKAAESQGLVGGNLRAAWVRSWEGPEALKHWSNVLSDVWRRYREEPWEAWPERIRETLELEVRFCQAYPDRVANRSQADSAFGGWEQVLKCL